MGWLPSLAVSGANPNSSGRETAVVPLTSAAANQASAIPAKTAPASAWKQWSAAQRAEVESVPWAQYEAAAGCNLISVSYKTAPASLGIPYAPATVKTTAVVTVSQCPSATSPASSLSVNPDISSGHQCKTITGPGQVCVGTTTVGGRPYSYGSYVYHGTHTEGHVQLSAEGALATTCHPVSSTLNGGTITFYNGYSEKVRYGPLTGTNIWDSAFWHSTTHHSPYTDWGNICAWE
jgi:hypothetical protein